MYLSTARKGRVAPLKAQSICRLELMEALIAAHLTETLAAELVTQIEKISFGAPATRRSWEIEYPRFTQS